MFKSPHVPSADLAGALQLQVLSGSSDVQSSLDQVIKNVEHLVYKALNYNATHPKLV